MVDAFTACRGREVALDTAERKLLHRHQQVEEDDRNAIESAIADLKKAMESSDKGEIEAKTQALAMASSKLAEKAYSTGSGEGGPEPVDANASSQSNTNDDVVDAEFEEVKEDDKK